MVTNELALSLPLGSWISHPPESAFMSLKISRVIIVNKKTILQETPGISQGTACGELRQASVGSVNGYKSEWLSSRFITPCLASLQLVLDIPNPEPSQAQKIPEMPREGLT